MNYRLLLLGLALAQLAGCAASWKTHYTYAPFDERRVADAVVSVTRPVVTTRPAEVGTPWGGLADRLHDAALERVDEPFVEARSIPLADLGWSEGSWKRIDDVADAVLSHVANPLPADDLRIEEGMPDAQADDLGADGFVLLVAVQPSMKETLARISGAAGEVVHFAGFTSALAIAPGLVGASASDVEGDLPALDPDFLEEAEREDLRQEEREVGSRPGKKRPPSARQQEKARLVGKQNRVDVAYLLVDRRTGRFVAAQGARFEPATRPFGSYRGSVERVLRDWRLVEEPWTSELLTRLSPFGGG